LKFSYLQLDQGLIQAEQTRQVTIELRQQTSNAVKFLLKLLLAGDIENVNLPLKELFLHQLEKMINEVNFVFIFNK
jgi:hypothetical protein